MQRTAAKTVLIVCMVIVLGVYAQVRVYAAPSYTTVASTIHLEGSANDGDIVSYDPSTNTYGVSHIFADEMMYGVVVRDPVLHLQDDEQSAASGTPIVRYGEVSISVSTLGGPIYAGDLITSSVLPGKGQRVARTEGTYVLGFALQDMTIDGNKNTVDGVGVELGTVPIALRIGPYVSREGAAFVASGSVNGLTSSVREDGTGGFDYFKMFRYSLAALVAISAVFIASRKFGDTFSQGVISIGRNPLAQSHIRSMVLWNAFLILVICAVGFGLGAAIVLVP